MAKKKKEQPLSSSIHDYPSSMSQYEREKPSRRSQAKGKEKALQKEES
jgi:hypothetical protein